MSNQPFMAIVKKVVDGDSLTITDGSKNISVRLWGIDAPEYDQPYSNFGKKYLKNNIEGKNIRITPVDMDKYGRLVALVDFDGVNINEQLIQKGYAWVHIYYCHREICSYWRELEDEARRKGKGLWRAESPIPPWKWKRRK